MPTSLRRSTALALALGLTLTAVACGDDGDAADATGPATPSTAPDDTDVPFENPYAEYASEVYADDGVWICRPDLRQDTCDEDLDATRVEPDGSFTPVPFEAADDPAADCFYVYPTIDYSPVPGNHPFDVPNPIEAVTVQGQAARFGSVCDLYVPRYRQATIASYQETDGGGLYEVEPFATAYADVVDAFRHYLATWNDGRPIVLLGHSQGSHHLVRLLQEEFDEVPALRGRLVSALLIGPTGRLEVPEGEVVGGSFQNIPLCTEADETGCVIAFDSYAASAPPTFGPPEGGPGEPPCVDPAALVDGDDRLTAGYFGGTVVGITTRTEVIEDYYTASCAESEQGRAYLEVAADPAPGDTRRLGHIPSLTASSESLHVLDINFALGDLLIIVERQIAAFADD